MNFVTTITDKSLLTAHGETNIPWLELFKEAIMTAADFHRGDEVIDAGFMELSDDR